MKEARSITTTRRASNATLSRQWRLSRERSRWLKRSDEWLRR